MPWKKPIVSLSTGKLISHVFAPNNGQHRFPCPQCNRGLWSGVNLNPDKEPIRRYDCPFCEIGAIMVHYTHEGGQKNGDNT
jgi:hypothetical protein